MILTGFSDAFLQKTPTTMWIRNTSEDLCCALLNFKSPRGTTGYYEPVAKYFNHRVGLMGYGSAGQKERDLWIKKIMEPSSNDYRNHLERVFLLESITAKLRDFEAELHRYKATKALSINNFGLMCVDRSVAEKITDFWLSEETTWFHGEYFILEHLYSEQIEFKKQHRKQGARSGKPRKKTKYKKPQCSWIDEVDSLNED